MGGAFTFRITDLRADDDDKNWEYQTGQTFALNPETRERNLQAVEIAREVFGERVVGLMSPLADTSGKHDERWSILGKDQVDWSAARHRPQVEALKDAGIQVMWGEAFRYHGEAIAVARLAKAFGMKALAVCFEANERGVPDPGNVGASYEFTDMKRDHFSDHDKLTFADLVEKTHRSADENERIARMVADFATPLPTFVDFWREAFRERGVRFASGCCGTTPAHVWVARKAFDESRAVP